MAAVVTKMNERRSGGVDAIDFDLTFGADAYAAGGQTLATPLASFNAQGREPDIVLVQAWNGYDYRYDPVNKKMLIYVATTAGTNLPESEHSAVTIVAAARTNIRILALWLRSF